MGICADDNLTGNNNPFFGQKGVLNAHLSNIEEVFNRHIIGEGAARLALLRRLDILIGCEVV